MAGGGQLLADEGPARPCGSIRVTYSLTRWYTQINWAHTVNADQGSRMGKSCGH
jgi:hypothetical protein